MGNKRIMATGALAVFVLLVSAGAGSGVVFPMESIPASDGTIHGCYKNHRNDKEEHAHNRRYE